MIQLKESHVLVVALVLATLVVLVGSVKTSHQVDAPLLADTARAHDAEAYRVDVDSLRSWADSVAQLRGDSLLRVWMAMQGRRRGLPVVLAPDTIRDTVRVPGALLRADAIQDSADHVAMDSCARALRTAETGRAEALERLSSMPRAARWTIGGGLVADFEGIRPVVALGRRWGILEVEGGAVVDKDRPGVTLAARLAF